MEQLQEAIENSTETDKNLNSAGYSYRKASLEGVAARRDNYLRETFRSQSPLNNNIFGSSYYNGLYSGSSTPMSSSARYFKSKLKTIL